MPALHQAPADGIAIVGPTASGKSAIALALAERFGAEIISMDSAQVYRGLDIGTAKPGAAERARVPHHLLDLREPWQSYSAADFAFDARMQLAELRARGKRGFIVGGTLLYLRALTQGLAPMPVAQPSIRTRLAQEATQLGWPALHARLATVDAVAAARIEPHDAQRIQRALEVWEASGRPLSSWWQGDTNHPPRESPHDTAADVEANIPASSTSTPHAAPRLLVLALMPTQRATLHQRIEARWQAMLAQGLLEEVRALRALPQVHAALPSMRCVGYRQAWDYLDSLAVSRSNPTQASVSAQDKAPSKTNYAAFVSRGLAATRQLAKRQLTWLRAMQPDAIVPCDEPQQALPQSLAVVQDWITRGLL